MAVVCQPRCYIICFSFFEKPYGNFYRFFGFLQEQLLNYQVEEGDQEHPALNELNQAVSILGQTNQALLQARSSDVESTQGALKTMEGALSDLENVQKKLSDDVGVFMQSYSSSVEIGRDSGDALVKRKKKSWFSVGRKNTK